MPVMAGGVLVKDHARACLLAEQEPQGPTLLKREAVGLEVELVSGQS